MIDRILTGLADDCADCRATLRRGKGPVHCPLRSDSKPSFDVQEGDGKPLIYCHACGGNNEEHIAALRDRGLWDVPKVIVNRGVPFSGRGAATASYDYHDASGNLARTICRDADKNFWVKQGAWPEADRVLYHLPEVLAAVAARQVVHVCEGEKDADALRSIGAVATTNPFGAGKFLDRYAQALIAADVVVWQDKDDAGRVHAKDVATKLSVAARSVKIVESPIGKDAADFVEAGGNNLALLALVAETPEWTSGERVIWTARDLATEYRDIIAKRIEGDPDYVGWRTGYPSIDKDLRYKAGDVWMVVAATSVGKSALMQSLQRRAAVPSVYFSLEMSRTQLVDRLIAAEADVDAWKLSVGNLDVDERRRVDDAIDRFETTDMQLTDSVTTTSAIESVLRIARVRFGVRLVYLDYIGLVADRDGESRYVQMSNVSHALKRIALSTGVCLVVGSQVNRKGDRKSGEPPYLDEIRDSGVVGEDADVILALGRAEGAPEAKLSVRKARNAPSGYSLPLIFDAIHATFMEPGEANMKKADARRDSREAEEIPY